VLAQTLISMDGSILNVATSILASPAGLHASPAQLQWALSGYPLVFAAAMFAGGALGDRHGPRTTLIAGLVVFGIASAGAAASATPGQLIAARAVLGLGGALLMPATLALVLRVSTDRQRPRAIALWASAAATGLAVGPVVGGALLSHFRWGAVFLVNLPVVLVCLVGAVTLLPDLRGPARRPLDPAGLALSVVGLFGVVFGVVQGGRGDWLRLDVLGPIGGGLAVLAVFGLAQARRAHPSFDVRLFRHPGFAAGNLTLLVAFGCVAGQLYYGNRYLQDVRGLTPLAAGLAVAPTAIGIVVGNLAAPALTRRWPAALVGLVGGLGAAASYAAYPFFDARTPVAWFALVMVVQGAAMGLVTVPATTTATAAVPPDRAAAGAAVTSAMRQVGAALGVAGLGSVLAADQRAGGSLLHAVHVSAIWTAGIAVNAALLVCVWTQVCISRE
jgi:EmrB/QacA subfamily drug resistance transporter